MNKWTPISIGHVTFQPGNFLLVAGPCSIEGHDQFLEVGGEVQKLGAQALRGGMFKLRTDPDSFQGLGREAFNIAKQVKEKTGMGFISEITDPRQVGDFYDVVDCYQVGSRNMHNYALLKELGKVDKPVLLKRGFSGLIKEWILAADYVRRGGNEQVILCERGIRTFETATRNTFDLNAIAYIKKHYDFPVIADPSHATGDSELVTPMALAAVVAGADGLLVEVHQKPENAFSDGHQALNFSQFATLTDKLKQLLPLVDKQLG